MTGSMACGGLGTGLGRPRGRGYSGHTGLNPECGGVSVRCTSAPCVCKELLAAGRRADGSGLEMPRSGTLERC